MGFYEKPLKNFIKIFERNLIHLISEHRLKTSLKQIWRLSKLSAGDWGRLITRNMRLRTGRDIRGRILAQSATNLAKDSPYLMYLQRHHSLFLWRVVPSYSIASGWAISHGKPLLSLYVPWSLLFVMSRLAPCLHQSSPCIKLEGWLSCV